MYIRSGVSVLVGLLLLLAMAGSAPAQTTTAASCGPDHAILYKRAVSLLDKAEKKLSARYTAEAKSLVKEANSLFSILQKECGPTQKERVLTDQETQQESINKKLAADALAQAERLMQTAQDKEKKSQEAEMKSQNELSISLQRQAKGEYELAHNQSIKAEIYALRNQQMLFSFLSTMKTGAAR